ncbi:MAG: glycosyltransferase [Desulfohalobiaceae bacterium]
MKIALLAGASTIHTIRWVNSLAQLGHTVYLITQHPCIEACDQRVSVYSSPYRSTAGYFLMVPRVRRLLRRLSPDVLNAHYASGYATTARMAGYRPWLLSVWGSDVYDFPEKSLLHRWWVRRNLLAADKVASTSTCMARQTRSLAPELGEIAVIPFGVDTRRFSAQPRASGKRSGQPQIVIGTVKKLAYKYGIDILILAFARLREDLLASDPDTAQRLRLHIVGDGPDLQKLRQLASDNHISQVTSFTGRVPHERVPEELARMDVYAALSRLDSESFGVAVIEASAARCPVVVSDAGGLPEVVLHGQTGLVVPRGSPEAAAAALRKLIQDPGLRAHMGQAGQAHVQRHYDWRESVRTMLNVLQATAQG